MSRKFRTGTTVLVSLGHLLHDIYTSFLAPLLPYLIEKHGLTLSLAGLLEVARNAPSLLNPLVGILADRAGIRYFVIAAPTVTAVCMSLLGAAPGYGVLLVLVLVTGLSSVCYHVPAPVIIKRISGTRTGTGMSFYMFGGELARTLGPLLIAGAVSWWGLEGSYRVMPLGMAASAMLYLKLNKLGQATGHYHAGREGLGATVRAFLPFFSLVAGVLLFRAGMKMALTLYLPTYLVSKGYSMWLAAVSLSILQLAGAGGTFLAGFISDRIGKTRVLLIAALACPPLVWLFVYATRPLMVALLVVLGFFIFAAGPVMLALVQDTNSRQPSFINSIYITINFGINALAVLVTGMLGDTIGLELTIKVCGILAACSVPFVLLLSRHHRQVA